MEHRDAPRPVNFKRRLPARLHHDPQVIKWAKRLAGDAKARPTDLSEEQLAFLMLVVAKRRGGVERPRYDGRYRPATLCGGHHK
jgi:hypothetical protein